MMRATVHDAWASYRAIVIPTDAGHAQVKECRRAFYAGAEMLLVEIMRGLSPGPDSTQSDEDYLGGLHQELLQFAADVKSGRA
jgi:hypothetical protein